MQKQKRKQYYKPIRKIGDGLLSMRQMAMELGVIYHQIWYGTRRGLVLAPRIAVGARLYYSVADKKVIKTQLKELKGE